MNRGQETGGRGQKTGGSVVRCFGVSVGGGQRPEVSGQPKRSVDSVSSANAERRQRPEVGGGIRYARRVTRHLCGFTLIEVMVTVAIIAIMSALLTPAIRGLLGVTGPRGGVNTVSAALEQARLSALENGVPSYLGWAPETADTASSALIVFRDKKEGEAANYTPVTRWLKLPQGVFLESTAGSTSVSAGATLPKLDTKAISSVSAVKFDRFGRLFQATTPVVLKVGAKASSGEQFMGGANQHFEVTVQPLTGRAQVIDKAMQSR